jgi:hypothetical protein
MPDAWHRGHAWKYFALSKQPRPVLVGRDLLAAGLEIEFPGPLICSAHRAIVEPVRRFVFVHDQFRVWKQQLAVRHVGQSCGMIRMHVGEQDGIDRRRIDAGGCKAPLNETRSRQQIIAAAGVDDREAALGMDQEGVDIGSPHRPERILEDPLGLFEIDVAHHVNAAVEVAVADRGDDDISDSAMIDAGNLLCGLRTHVGRPWWD